jgi:hypothetical protein
VGAALGGGLASGGAVGNADGVEEVIADGGSDSVAADDPGAGDDTVVQAVTRTDRTNDAGDRNNQGASAALGTYESRTCYDEPGERSCSPSVVPHRTSP